MIYCYLEKQKKRVLTIIIWCINSTKRVPPQLPVVTDGHLDKPGAIKHVAWDSPQSHHSHASLGDKEVDVLL